jgi:hypothetical protein
MPASCMQAATHLQPWSLATSYPRRSERAQAGYAVLPYGRRVVLHPHLAARGASLVQKKDDADAVPIQEYERQLAAVRTGNTDSLYNPGLM